MKNDIENRISQAVKCGVQLGFDLCDLDLSNDTNLEKDLVKKDKAFKDWNIEDLPTIVKKYIDNNDSFCKEIIRNLCLHYNNVYHAWYDVRELLNVVHIQQDEEYEDDIEDYHLPMLLNGFIYQMCEDFGPNINLNWIDVSKMKTSHFHYHLDNEWCDAGIFSMFDYSLNEITTLTDPEDLKKAIWDTPFNGDISQWDVSQWKDMSYMFDGSRFNGDISQWDVSNVENMREMFAFSEFDGDISKWDISNVKNMRGMFSFSKFNGDISQWDVHTVTNMNHMFSFAEFNGDISQWDVSSVTDMSFMFENSKFKQDISQWDINNVKNVLYMFNLCTIREEYKPKKM